MKCTLATEWFSPKSSNQQKHLQTMVFVVVQTKSA
jgi:hypothetical protein